MAGCGAREAIVAMRALARGGSVMPARSSSDGVGRSSGNWRKSRAAALRRLRSLTDKDVRHRNIEQKVCRLAEIAMRMMLQVRAANGSRQPVNSRYDDDRALGSACRAVDIVQFRNAQHMRLSQTITRTVERFKIVG